MEFDAQTFMYVCSNQDPTKPNRYSENGYVEPMALDTGGSLVLWCSLLSLGGGMFLGRRGVEISIAPSAPVLFRTARTLKRYAR